jgi:heptosyltransferase-2
LKILIVKIGAIGDVCMARAMLQAAPPQAEITWLCGNSVAPLVRLFPGRITVMPVDDAALLAGSLLARLGVLAGIWMRLAGKRFDLVATGHSDGRYALLSLTVAAALRRSFATERLVRGRFFGDEYARLIHGLDGPAAPRARYQALAAARPGALKGGRWALLFPGGARNLLRDNALRRWPLEHYAALTGLLKKKGWKVAFAGAESDAWVRPAMLKAGALDLLGRFGLDATLGLCAEASLVVTHDSGPMHLAAASGTRVLALFGPTPPSDFASGYENVEPLWGGADLACRPCYDGKEFAPCTDNRCLGDLAPGAVMRVLGAARAR